MNKMLHKAFSLIVSGTTLLPIWFRYRTLVNIKKAWNRIFAYSLYRGSGKPFRKNKQATPTPNMNATKQSSPLLDALRRDIHIPKGVYCLLVLGESEMYQISIHQNKR